MYVHMREALAAGVEPAAVMTDEVTMRAALRLQELDSLIEPRV